MLVICLCSLIAGNTSYSSSDSTGDTIRDTTDIIVDLSLGLLFLALLVLPTTGCFQRLHNALATSIKREFMSSR